MPTTNRLPANGAAQQQRTELIRQRPSTFPIGIAAELAGVHPQTLRLYEREGLVLPRRTSGNIRHYSAADVELVQRIHALTTRHGVNLAGVRALFMIEAHLAALLVQFARIVIRLRALDAKVAATANQLRLDIETSLPPATPSLPAAALQDAGERTSRHPHRGGFPALPPARRL